MSEKINLNDLYFGIRLYSLSYSSREGQKLETYNLFDFSRVKTSVAQWVALKPEIKRAHDIIEWCFGDVHWRAEFEYILAPLLEEDRAEKVDVYEMYVVPNRKLLTDMINRVSLSSATKFITEERKRMKGV